MHLSNGESKGETNGKRETLGDASNSKNNSIIECLGESLENFRAFTNGGTCNDGVNNHLDENNSREDQSEENDLVLDILELLLERSILISVQLVILGATKRVLTNAADESLSITVLDDASGSEEGVRPGVFVDWLSGVLLIFWLINLKSDRLDDEAVGWDSGTSLKKDDITNDEIPN